MIISEILEKSINILKKNRIDNSNFLARLLLANVLGKSKEYIIIHNKEEITDVECNEYFEKIVRLKDHEPIQYILNNQEFMGINFYVDENVLIPQPDTEILVEEVIKIAQDNEKKYIKILDLCTGSGAIGISIAKILKNSKVYVSDISEAVLKIAKRNALQNNVNISFFKSDMFENILEKDFDIIVSNPPYIETGVISTLSEEVKREPMLALDGGKDGLNFYRQIAINAKKYLSDNGVLALEIGYNQKKSVEKLLKKNNYNNIYSKKDLSGNDRIIICNK